jgi:hypothetical protein
VIRVKVAGVDGIDIGPWSERVEGEMVNGLPP